MKEIIRGLIGKALLDSVRVGGISLDNPESVSFDVSKTKDEKFGDYASNIALVLSASAGLKPRDLAAILKEHLEGAKDVVEKVEIAGPGFINFFLTRSVLEKTLLRISFEKQCFGSSPADMGAPVLLEFVSANPTGPLHVGHGRGAAVGDTLARLLKFCGYNVTTEYYVNDIGNQMRILGRSVLVRYEQLSGADIELPENHYMGDYVSDIARDLKASSLNDKLELASEDDAVDIAYRFASDSILRGIKDDLEYFGVRYDNYFSEAGLHKSGALKAVLENLRAAGRTEEHEGAVWFKTEDQDEKDRVLVRATGEPTYFAADAAYHQNKIQRGFETLIDIWGSDHHGYVPRVKACIEALGCSPETLKVLLVQFVTLIKEGVRISMSTRSGEFITLREVLEEVGPDAARFFFLTKRSDSHLDFDLDLAKKQSKDNPVYYVQYAHARVASIFRIAAERGIPVDLSNPQLDLLALPEEQRIIKHMAEFPDMLAEAAEALEPHRVTFYLLDLAELFHSYYHDNKVLQNEEALKNARLFLIEAVRQVIANGLDILGVSAPDRM